MANPKPAVVSSPALRQFWRRMFLDPSIGEFPPGSGVPKVFTMSQLGLIDERGAWDEDQFLKLMDIFDAMYANRENLPAANIGILILILRGELDVDGKIIGEAVPISPFLSGLCEEELKTARKIIATMLLPGMNAESLFPADTITQKQIAHVEKCCRWLVPKNEKPFRGLDLVRHLVKLPSTIYTDPAQYSHRRARKISTANLRQDQFSDKTAFRKLVATTHLSTIEQSGRPAVHFPSLERAMLFVNHHFRETPDYDRLQVFMNGEADLDGCPFGAQR